MSRIMAIDYGSRRIGIALTDPLRIIASGYKTLENSESIIDEIISILKEKSVSSVVIGIPFTDDHGIGRSAYKILQFASLLINAVNSDINLKSREIIFYEQDERFSTFSAEETMSTIKVKKKKQKQLVDTIAATQILKEFIDSTKKIELNVDKYTRMYNTFFKE